jgi:hypothetical protein
VSFDVSLRKAQEINFQNLLISNMEWRRINWLVIYIIEANISEMSGEGKLRWVRPKWSDNGEVEKGKINSRTEKTFLSPA